MLLLFCALLLCGGCAGRQLEEQMLVIILGVDRTEEGVLQIYVKVPSNASSSSSGASSSASSGGSSDGSSGGSSGQSGEWEQMGYFVLEASGHSFSDAIELLNASTPRSLNFSQVREVVVGERAAADASFGALIEEIYSLPRMRPAATVVCCKGEGGKFVEAQQPYVGIRLSRYIETTLSNYAGKGFVPNTSLGEVMRDLRYGFRDPLLVHGAINSFQNQSLGAGDNSLDGMAGGLPRRSINPVELFGASATDGVSVSGTLNGYEMALIHLAEGHVQSLVLQTEAGPMPVFARVPATLGVETREGGVCLRLAMMCEVHYTPGLSPRAEEIKTQLEKDFTAVIAHLQALRCDGMGFGNIAVRKYWKMEDWEKIPWRDLYTRADVDVRVSVQLRKN